MTATATVDLRQIPLTLLKPTEFNPRRIRPDDPKLAELAASITSGGGSRDASTQDSFVRQGVKHARNC